MINSALVFSVLKSFPCLYRSLIPFKFLIYNHYHNQTFQKYTLGDHNFLLKVTFLDLWIDFCKVVLGRSCEESKVIDWFYTLYGTLHNKVYVSYHSTIVVRSVVRVIVP